MAPRGTYPCSPRSLVCRCAIAVLCAFEICTPEAAAAAEMKSMQVVLSGNMFHDTICLLWGYNEALKFGYDLYLPKDFNATRYISRLGGNLTRFTRDSKNSASMDCPSNALLTNFLLTSSESRALDIHLTPLVSPSRLVRVDAYKHLHLSISINLSAEIFMLSKNADMPLVVTCEDAQWPSTIKELTDLYELEVIDLCLPSKIRVNQASDLLAIAMHADLFFGTANTDTVAYVVQERRRLGLWAGEVGEPIVNDITELFAASSRTPWVFTYNDGSPGYDYMLKALVTSSKGNFNAFCMFSGSFESPIAVWLTEHKVRLLVHKPAWEDKFWEIVKPFSEVNLKHSHLYGSKTMVVGTWQRIDIPIIHDLQQFRFILFTDADVYFHNVPSYAVMRAHLPTYVSMAPEMQDIFPYNAGIMIMNMKNLHASYQDFLSFILENKHGLYFPNFGPGDQGAYNEFYETWVRREMLPKVFNAKPYQTYNDDAWIVHFHGPKPWDYHDYFTTGACRFHGMCRDGLTNGFCKYVSRWAPFCSDGTCTRIRLMCQVTEKMC